MTTTVAEAFGVRSPFGDLFRYILRQVTQKASQNDHAAAIRLAGIAALIPQSEEGLATLEDLIGDLYREAEEQRSR